MRIILLFFFHHSVFSSVHSTIKIFLTSIPGTLRRWLIDIIIFKCTYSKNLDIKTNFHLLFFNRYIQMLTFNIYAINYTNLTFLLRNIFYSQHMSYFTYVKNAFYPKFFLWILNFFSIFCTLTWNCSSFIINYSTKLLQTLRQSFTR